MNRCKVIVLSFFKIQKPFYVPGIIGLLVFLSLFFYISSTEKSDELVFLENVMIREGGLYVLMGSKPMVSFAVKSAMPETEEEYQKYIEYVKVQYPEDKIETYEEYKLSHKVNKHLYYWKLWVNWKAKMRDYVGPHFQFVTRKHPFGETLFWENIDGLFINNCSLLYILTTYYSEVESVFGDSFDPQKILYEISDPNSIFWERAFRNQYTQGLLFGYGPRNSFNFKWQIEKNFPFPIRRFQDMVPLLKKKVKVSDLRLPTITQYFLGDPVLENYKLQRREILEECKNKDFESTVKQWLKIGMGDPCKNLKD